MNFIKEAAVGIIGFANNAPGFQGIHKQRFSDFIVREIDMNGNITRLLFADVEQQQRQLQLEKEASKEPVVEGDVVDAIVSAIETESSSKVKASEELKNFLRQCVEKDPSCPPSLLAFPCAEKPLRTKMHALLKKHLSLFEADTVLEKGSQHVRLMPRHRLNSAETSSESANSENNANNNNNNNKRSKPSLAPLRRASNWPRAEEYAHFTLLKENACSLSALSVLGRLLRLSPACLSVAGLKDRRAVTAQRVSARRRDWAAIDQLNRAGQAAMSALGRGRGAFMKVGDVSYHNEPLKTGQLLGNRFCVTLRSVTLATEAEQGSAAWKSAAEKEVEIEEVCAAVRAACSSVAESGFVNFFGLQRFGKGSVSTAGLGLLCLRGDFNSVLDSLLGGDWGEKNNSSEKEEGVEKVEKEVERGRDWANIRKAGELYRKGLFSESLRQLPAHMSMERAALTHLTERENEVVKEGEKRVGKETAMGAVLAMPRHARSLFVHAYQSLLFNRAAAARLGAVQAGVQGGVVGAMKGDLVMLGEREAEEVFEEEAVLGTELEVDDSFKTEEAEEMKESEDVTAEKKETEEEEDKYNSLIHVVTDEDVREGKYTIFDVVIPLLGSGSILPSNFIGDYMIELLQKDGLSLSSFSSCHPSFRTRGQYRRLMQRAKDFEWEIKRYSNIDEELVETEVKDFKQASILQSRKRFSSQNKNNNIELKSEEPKNDEQKEILSSEMVVDEDQKEVGSEVKGDLVAVVLQFSLPPGCYATMLLRELTKQSTETVTQANLTVASRTSNTKGKEIEEDKDVAKMDVEGKDGEKREREGEEELNNKKTKIEME